MHYIHYFFIIRRTTFIHICMYLFSFYHTKCNTEYLCALHYRVIETMLLFYAFILHTSEILFFFFVFIKYFVDSV